MRRKLVVTIPPHCNANIVLNSLRHMGVTADIVRSWADEKHLDETGVLLVIGNARKITGVFADAIAKVRNSQYGELVRITDPDEYSKHDNDEWEKIGEDLQRSGPDTDLIFFEPRECPSMAILSWIHRNGYSRPNNVVSLR